MKNLLILAFCSISLLTYAQFSSDTTKQIDVIENNAASDILLKPNDKVDIDYFLGEKALQSTIDGELEESSVTNTELGFLSGVTSGLQGQIDAKQDTLTGVDGDLYYYNSGLANLNIGSQDQILSVSALGFPEWIDLPPSVSVTTKGDLQTYSTMPDRLPVGSDTQILSANSATSTGLEWIDVPVSLPDQTGNEGLYLTTDGSNASWNEINDDVNEIKNNFLECSGFDGCTQEGTITNGAGVDASSIVARSVETTAFNPSKLNLSQSLAGTLDYTYTKTASFSNKQLVAYCEIKTSNTGVTFSAGADSVEAGSLEVSSDDSWKYYKIPLVGGATDQYFKIDHSDAGTIPDIDVDNCFIGKSPDTIKELGQASFVGSLFYGISNCRWETTSATYSDFPVDSDCTATDITGNVQAPDTKLPAVKIPSARTDGYYRVTTQGLLFATATDTTCFVSLSSTSSSENQGSVYFSSSQDGTLSNNIEGSFRFLTDGDKTIRIIGRKGAGTGSCLVYGENADLDRKFTVHFFPDDNSTVVTQDTELTAKTANTFSFDMNNAGVVTNDSYDFINGNCTQVNQTTYYQYNCALNDLNITQPLNCSAINSSGAGLFLIGYRRSASSTSQISFTTQFSNSNSILAAPINVICQKADIDLNKSATIIGKFEQVEEVNKTLTAAEVNTFVAYIDTAGNVSSENYDWINGNCTVSDGERTCDISSLNLANNMVCQATGVQSSTDRPIVKIKSISTTSVVVDTYPDNSASAAYSFMLTCEKSGTDYNKNLSGVIINASKAKQEIADIVREDIVSSDLSIVYGNSTSYTASVFNGQYITFDEVTDNNNIWSGNLLTAQRDACYKISGRVRFATSTAYFEGLHKNSSGTTISSLIITNYQGSTNARMFDQQICLSSGDTWGLTPSATITQENTGSHFINITEIADTESVLKSLVNETLTKCQTKVLSADVTANGVITDWVYSNLTVGKKYKFMVTPQYNYTTSALNDKRARIDMSGAWVKVVFNRWWAYGQAELSTSTTISPVFIAQTTTLTPTLFERANANISTGSISQLCELPDTYVDTTEF
jgi:hypothetical protein